MGGCLSRRTGPGHAHPQLEAAIVPVPSLVDDNPRVLPEHPYSRALVAAPFTGGLFMTSQ
jgi:hypothetical protein